MKDKIITAATKLFIKFGYKTVTMEEIAKEIGISKKTLYKTYDSKEKLVSHVASSVKNELFQKIEEMLTRNYDPVRENFEIQKFIIDIYKDIPEAASLELRKYYPETYSKEISVQYAKLIDYFIQNTKKGIELGFYLKNLDVEYCARLTLLLLTASAENLKQNQRFGQYPEKVILYNIRALSTNKGEETLLLLESKIGMHNPSAPLISQYHLKTKV